MNSLKRHPVTDLRQNILCEDYPHMAGAYIVIQCGASRAGNDAGYIREEHAEQWDRMQRLAQAAPDLLSALKDAEFLLRKVGQLAGPMQDSFNRSAADARAAISKAKANP